MARTEILILRDKSDQHWHKCYKVIIVDSRTSRDSFAADPYNFRPGFMKAIKKLHVFKLN